MLSTSHTRAYPFWPQPPQALWLGGCSQSRRQARQLARVRSVFSLPPSEQLRDSWGCSRVSADGGWVQRTDEATGKQYFWNTVTNATQWERPADGGGKAVRGRLYLMSNHFCFVGAAGAAEGRFVLRLEQMANLHISKAVGVRASAAVTLVGPEGGVQFCGFSNRNRAFRETPPLNLWLFPHDEAPTRTSQ